MVQRAARRRLHGRHRLAWPWAARLEPLLSRPSTSWSSAIIGGLFVVEALSVIIQVGYFKMTGNRVFLMAPIHHHFEQKGWPESQVVIRFWIVSLILALIGLATLKVR